MGGTFEIRKATASDADQIHEIHTKSVRELCKEHYTPKQIAGWLKNRMSNRYLPGIEGGGMFVAVKETIIVGFGHAVRGEIVAVYVDPEYIRQGVGTLILTHGINIARHEYQGAIRVDATINAREFYAQAGFVETGRKSAQRNDVFLPIIVMELQDKI